jgi:V/A-type H+-transporting ATPase subunit A
MYSTVQKQVKMLKIIVTYYRLSSEAIKKGVTLIKLRRMGVVEEITRMKYKIANDEIEKLDALQKQVEREMQRLGEIYEQS